MTNFLLTDYTINGVTVATLLQNPVVPIMALDDEWNTNLFFIVTHSACAASLSSIVLAKTVGVMWLAGASMRSRAKFWPSAYRTPFSQPTASLLGTNTYRNTGYRSAWCCVKRFQIPVKFSLHQLSAVNLPSMQLCCHFGLLLGFELVILKQTQNSTFCCWLGVTTGVHLHMIHLQVLE